MAGRVPLLATLVACTVITAFAGVVAAQRPVSVGLLPAGGQVALHVTLAASLLAEVLAMRGVHRDGAPGAWVWRAGFALGVLGTAAWLVYSDAFKALFLLFHWGVVAGVFAALVRGGPALARRLPARAVRGLDFVVFTLCASAVVAELGLRALALLSRSPVFDRVSTPAHQIARYRDAPGSVRFGFTFNSRGMHDAEPVREPGKRFVAVIGDSFSVGVVPHWFHYTTVCERELGDTMLYNIGVTTIGPAEYLLLAEQEALPLAPDLLIVALFVGNDVYDSLRYHDDHPLLREVFDRARVQLVQVPQRLATLYEERARTGRAPGTLAGEHLAAAPTEDPAQLVKAMPALADPLREEPTFSRENYMARQFSRIAAACNADRRGYARLFATLTELRRRCGGTPLQVLLIPDEFQVEDGNWRDALAERGDPADYERDLPQRLIGAWLHEEGIPFLDLLPILRGVPPLADGDRHLYLLRDTHFNARGNEVAGRALAAFLR